MKTQALSLISQILDNADNEWIINKMDHILLGKNNIINQILLASLNYRHDNDNFKKSLPDSVFPISTYLPDTETVDKYHAEIAIHCIICRRLDSGTFLINGLNKSFMSDKITSKDLYYKKMATVGMQYPKIRDHRWRSKRDQT